jgi:hypothetical protein
MRTSQLCLRECSAIPFCVIPTTLNGIICADPSYMTTDTTGIPAGTTIECKATTSQYCTGGGNIGRECLWSVTLPTCSPPDPPNPPPPSGPCPKGKACYIQAADGTCTCVLGACTLKCGADEFLTKDAYGVCLRDGMYSFPAICENGKALSNAAKGKGDFCVKKDVTEDGSIALKYEVESCALKKPVSMKCGTVCYLYGGWMPDDVQNCDHPSPPCQAAVET